MKLTTYTWAFITALAIVVPSAIGLDWGGSGQADTVAMAATTHRCQQVRWLWPERRIVLCRWEKIWQN